MYHTRDDNFDRALGNAAGCGAFLIFFLYLFLGLAWLIVWLKDHPKATKMIFLVLAWGIAEWLILSWFLRLIAG
jgi:hypothetical protein